MKNYIGISRDHSGSMRPIASAAARDYNLTINVLKDQAINHKQETFVSVVKCGVGSLGVVGVECAAAPITALQPIAENAYKADANSTPLLDSVGELITLFESSPDVNDPETSFLVMAITDGEENSSRLWSPTRLMKKIQQLQNTDRWTFVFRVPHGGKKTLLSMGVPSGNILEWETTERGMEQSTQITSQAFQNYYSNRAAGQRSTKSFYMDLSAISEKEIKTELVDISSKVNLFVVQSNENGKEIKTFIEERTNKPYLKGAAFYQLTKTEKEVQSYKVLVVRDKFSGKIYGGQAARQLLGLPSYGTVRLVPEKSGKFDVFIQSTSLNRKLVSGSIVLYWPTVQ